MQARGRTQRDRDANGGALLLLAAAGASDDHTSPAPAEWSSEREEISRAKRDPAAFAPLYERYVDAVYTYCLRRIGNADIAADMTAGVFTRALAALPRFREDGGSFRSWLFSIAHNTVVDSYRRHRDHASLDGDDIGRTLAHQGDGPERIAMQSDLRDAFQEAMAHLTDAQREVVAMRLAGLTGPEIAQAMGTTIPGMKSTQYRAYARLRELLRPTPTTFPPARKTTMNENQMHDDLDRYLDNLVRGQQPDAADDLAGFAREIQTQHGATRMDPDRRGRIWDDVIAHASAGAAPTTGGGGPLSQPALVHPALGNPWDRRQDDAPATPTGWRGTTAKATTALAFITAMVLLVATIAMFRQGDGGSTAPADTVTGFVAMPTQMMTASQGSSVTPMGVAGTGDLAVPPTIPPGTEHPNTGNLAVPPTAEGTTTAGTGDLIVPGGASPEPGDVDWHAAIAPEECTPRPSDTGEEAIPEPALAPFGTPSAREAENVAMTMRQYQACISAGQPTEGYETGRFTTDTPEMDEASLARVMAGEEISAIYGRMDRSEFVVTIEAPETTPVSAMVIREGSGVFQPHHAVQLADGRIAMPTTHRFPGWMSIDDFSALNGTVYVLAEVDGRWLIDQMLPFCVGDCEQFWAGMGLPGAPTPKTIGTPGTVVEDGEVALVPVDDSIWLACPDSPDPGQITLSTRHSESGAALSLSPATSWGPSVPPTIPCDVSPEPEPPPGFEPVPMELPEAG